ncbi:S9 family peptidase [Candidatus Bipolaricaulota bacterium]|nr:S9 family peptidase [Candidatus Bipolaricaulota bacterium]
MRSPEHTAAETETPRGVQIEDLLRYRFLSSPKVSPDARWSAFVVKQASADSKGYDSNLFLVDLEGGGVRQLTSSGKDGVFVWSEDSRSIIFASKRDEKTGENGAKREPSTDLYRIFLNGGEALPLATVPLAVEQLRLADDHRLLIMARMAPGTSELGGGDNPTSDGDDYEVLDEIPYWQNGIGFTNRRRVHLFVYDLETSETEELLREEGDLEIASFDVLGGVVAATGRRFGGKAPVTDELWTVDVDEGRTRCLSRDTLSLGEPRFLTQDHVAVLGTDMGVYGLNQSREVYVAELASGTLGSITPDWERMPGNRVTGDCRHGGGPTLLAHGGSLYVVVTDGGNAVLEKVLRDGNVERMADIEGSIDAFDVCDRGLVYVALRADCLQELYIRRGDRETRLTSINGEALVADLPLPEAFSVRTADGTEIDAWMIRPVEFESGRSYPSVLEIHGGPKTAYGTVFIHEMQMLAAHGYAVIYCNPRGSAGRGDEFAEIRGKYGTVDYEDIMAVVDHALTAYPFLDSDRIGVTGGSYGGYMTNWIIGHTDRFAAACSQRSIANWASMMCTTDIGYFFTPDQIAASPWDEGGVGADKLWWHSPLKYADKAATPTLFIHSEQDYRCWLTEGLQMFTALRAHGVDSRLVIFRGENHELSRSGKPLHRIRRLQEMLDWFDKYLKGNDV